MSTTKAEFMVQIVFQHGQAQVNIPCRTRDYLNLKKGLWAKVTIEVADEPRIKE